MSNTERDHILSVTVENFKIIREATINDMGDVVEIKGDTGQGKSSIIEAIRSAISGFDPSLIRYGSDDGSITVETSKVKLLRKQTSYGTGKGTLKVTDKNTGRDIAKSQEFLAALFPTASVFDPLEFILLGGGESKGKTERLRRQRDMLLEAIPFKTDDEYIRAALVSMDIAAVETLENGGADMRFVDYDRHALEVCEDLRERVYSARRVVNSAKEEAERNAAKAPSPDMKPKATVEELAATLAGLNNEKREAETQARLREASVRRRDELKAEIEAKREGLKPIEEINAALEGLNKQVAEADKDIAEVESEIRILQERLTNLHAARKEKAEAIARGNAAIERHGAVTTLEKSLESLTAEIGIDKSGAIKTFTEQIAAAESALESRKAYDAHRKAHDEAEAARKKAAIFDEAVTLFRDKIPQDIIGKMKMPVEGLSVEEGVVTMHGIPLHQLGTSEQIKVGVVLATAFNPKTGFICIDRAESLGKKDRLALREAAKEAGVQLILTTVDPDAVPSEGVVVMENGTVKK